MKRKKQSQRKLPASPPGSKATQPVRLRLSLWKKLLFSAGACAGILVLIELVLAIAGVKPASFEKDPYVGFSSRLPLFVEDTDAREPGLMVTARNKQRFFNVQRFAAKKPADTYRIFCLGGSTTYGHPYADQTSFSGWLREYLPKADPSRRWEVINCGGISYASYRVALLMEELIQYQPDLFIVYSGQNEFLEARTYSRIIAMPEALRGADALLNRTRLHAAVKGAVEKLRGAAPAAVSPTNALPAEVETLLERVVGPQAYQRDEAQQKSIIDHYRYNLSRMVDIAESAGAGVMFVTPASNLRHCSPFKSEHRAGLGEAALARWQSLILQAQQAANGQRWTEALALLDQALAIDDRFADVHYLRGRVLLAAERYPEARAAFIRARDEDVCPLRILSPMLAVVADVGRQRGAPLVDFVSLIDGKAQHGIPGDDWFLDHVHPTIEGNRLLALALIDQMAGRGFVKTGPGWNDAVRAEVKKTVENRLSPTAHGVALCTQAKVLAWAGKHQEAYGLALRAARLAPEDPAAWFETGKNAMHLGRNEEAGQHLQKALALQPGFVEARALLGRVMSSTGKTEEAIKQCRQALAQRPDDPELHLNLGGLLAREGKSAEATTAFREALRLSPNYAEAHGNLGWVLKEQGEFTEALSHFREAVRLKPAVPSTAIGFAQLLATHPDPRQRNPAQAIQISERLVDQSAYKNWLSLDALASAYAADGRFEQAVAAQRKAVDLVRAASPTDAPAAQARLELYEKRQPFVEGTRKASQGK